MAAGRNRALAGQEMRLALLERFQGSFYPAGRCAQRAEFGFHKVLPAWLAVVFFALLPASSQSAETPPTSQPEHASNTISEWAGREIHMGFLASVQLDIIHDFDAIGLNGGDGVPHEFVTSQIPVGGRASEFTNRTLFSPNQSTLTLWASTPTRYGEAKGQVVLNMTRDLFDTRLQVYKAVGEVGGLRFGLDYSLFLNQAALPTTLDFEGPPVLAEARFAQLSVRASLGRPGGENSDLFVVAGMEDAGSNFILPEVVGIRAESQVPALLLKLGYETEEANVELGAVYRRMGAKGNGGYEAGLNGWGLHLSGFARFLSSEKVMFGVLGGRGIASYIDDTAGLNLDAAPVAFPSGALKTVGLLGAWVGYEHRWSPVLHSTATVSFLRAYTDFIDRKFGPTYSSNTPGEFVGIFRESFYSSVNVVWSPAPWLDTGVEYLYGHRKVAPGSSSYDSNEGHDNRLQFTIRLKLDYSR